MKRIILMFIGVIISTVIVAQNTEKRELSSFDKIKVVGEIKVYLTQGDKEDISITTKDIPTSDIVTKIKEQTLIVELKGNIYNKVYADIYITYKQLREITLSAAASISQQSIITGDKIFINANTSSEFDGELKTTTAEIKVGQGATVRLRGQVNNYEVQTNTGGILSALDLQSDSTYVRVTSGSTAKVYAKSYLEANVLTGGSLTYTGNPPQKNIKTFIGATIIEQ